ncbi:DUF2911 domain-containing protein [Sphingobacterium sp. N143]|uniref:DUF2911 domain-containing protein n=1 Tax=Sphingobacterium sp. N143 TaxID=2746727 RepID=UPI0025790562|nr:DUF2911 domain-containing protein [Sphingobacterium sp. N143]MDM1293660.1 DUF2911 domain-containing protein [Sphingobacterium sp. N143]
MRILVLTILTLIGQLAFAQTDKSKRPSPPDSVKVTTTDGVTIDIHYSRPSLKGRQLGVDIAPIGTVWRTGANEATTIEFDKDVLVEGKKLAAGKYGLYSIPGEHETTIMFNKVWNQWGTKYDEKEDALRISVSNGTANNNQEQFKIGATPEGTISLEWGEYIVPFNVKASN